MSALVVIAIRGAGVWAEWLTAIATVALVVVAWVQLGALKLTSRADFIHRLSADFCKPGARRILRALERQDCKFDPDSQKFIAGDVTFDTYELDDFVLGPLESLALFEQRGIVDLSMVRDFFGWYIVTVWENSVVQEYCFWQAEQPEGADVYTGLARVYRLCKAIRSVR
ncbi:MAG TPA: hypothetical protein VGL35_09440 [Rhizomicrobium sp.]